MFIVQQALNEGMAIYNVSNVIQGEQKKYTIFSANNARSAFEMYKNGHRKNLKLAPNGS